MVDGSISRLGDFFGSSREKGIEGLPLMSVTLNDGLVLRESLERKTDSNLDPGQHLIVKHDFIAYNMMRVWQGALGRATQDGLVSPAYVVLKPSEDVDSHYAEYLFKTARMIYLFWAYSYGLTRDRLRLYYNDFARIPIDLPPLPEQKKIAQILSTWDKAIATTEKMLANSQQQKKALMQQLLTGKKRLLDKDGVRFSGEWVDNKLLSLASPEKNSFTDGDWIESPYITDKGCRLIQTGNIGVGEFRNKNRKYISEASFLELNCTEVTTGDLLICRLAEPAGRACVVPDVSDEKMLTSVDVTILKVDPLKTSANYLSYYFSLDKTLYDVSALCGGSTRSRVSRTNLGKMNIKLPTVAEQVAIISVINAAQIQVNKIEDQLQELRQEKISLMQQLLTGKRRVKTDEVPA